VRTRSTSKEPIDAVSTGTERMDMFMALPCSMNVVFICVYTEDMMTLVTQMGRQP